MAFLRLVCLVVVLVAAANASGLGLGGLGLGGVGLGGLGGLRGVDVDGDGDADAVGRLGLAGVGLGGVGLGYGDKGNFAWGYDQPKGRGRVDVARLGPGAENTRIVTRVGNVW